MKPICRLLTALAVLSLPAGCLSPRRGPESSFYQLQPDAELRPVTAEGLPRRIVLHPVEVADYLERPQVVRREKESRLRYLETHRWSGPVADNATDVLYLNLRRLLGDRVHRWPADTQGGDAVRVDVRLYRLEAVPGGGAEIKAGVRIRAENSQRTWIVDLEAPVEGNGMDDAVAAQSRLLSKLSERLVVELRAIE